jgi:hypothetical protein
MAFRELFSLLAWCLGLLAWFLGSFLGSLAWEVFELLCNLLVGIVVFLVRFGGPIAWLVGWVSMARRLNREQPDHPLMNGTWDESLGNWRPAILMIYFETYGLDDKVALMGAAMVVTILGLYIARPLADIFSHLLKYF